jgi:4-pyridoxolactonase
MKVWLLDNGSIVIEHTQLLWNVPGAQVRIPVYSVLIEHDEGLFLFDTGIDLEHMDSVLPWELPEQTPEQTIPAQLETCGFSAGDVTTLVNSHLHIDHVGGNKHFAGTGTRNVLHAKELAQARNHQPFEFFGYSDKSWDYEGANFHPVTGDLELAKGLWLYETPGHTVGHYSLLVDPGGGGKAMLFAFDVVYTAAGFEKGIQPGFHNDPVAGVRSIQRVRDLAVEHDADLFFSHDMDAWHEYRHAPAYYGLGDSIHPVPKTIS